MQDFVDKAKGVAGQGMDYLKANPRIAAMLLAGGGAGLAAGGLTAREPERRNETGGSRRMRILRNALLAGGAGAGVVGLGAEGWDRLKHAQPVDAKNPVQEKVTGPGFRGAMGLALGTAGYLSGNKKDTADFASQARRDPAAAGVKFKPGMTSAETLDAASRVGVNPNKATDVVTRGIGKIKPGLLQKAVGALAGTTRGGRFGRIGLGAGLFAPEVLAGAKDLTLGAIGVD